MISVFNYTDYRKFLLDAYQEHKKADRHFTYRHIAAKAGFRSAGFFSQILEGQSNVSERIGRGLAAVFGLDESELRYFLYMVEYNQAGHHETKKTLFLNMMRFAQARICTINPDHFEYFDKWYYGAIRALLAFEPFNGNCKELGRRLVPPVGVAAVRKAVSVLEKLGMIEAVVGGGWRITNQLLSTGPNTDSVVLNNFIISTLDIAHDALYRFTKEERTFSAHTLGLSARAYQNIREKLDTVRREIMEIAQADTGADSVYQLNMQFFPLAPARKGERNEDQ